MLRKYSNLDVWQRVMKCLSNNLLTYPACGGCDNQFKCAALVEVIKGKTQVK
jgi:hypothetical protein